MHRLWARILISVSAGLLAALVCYFFQTHWFDRGAADLTWALLGARGWLAGKNPYNLPSDPSLYPYDQGAPLFYPFPAVLATLPLAPLPDTLAATLWIGLTVGLMTYALLGEGAWRLPILASLPLWAAVFQVQWTPLLMVIWVWPAALPLFLFKPNIGLALSTKKLSPKGIIGCLVVLALSLILLPTWPADWLQSARASARHLIPILYGPGPLLLLALMRWRQPEARLLLVLACMPQRMGFYDQLPLLLVARNLRQQLILVLSSWLSMIALLLIGPSWNWPSIWHPQSVDGSAGWVILFTYGTALGIVLMKDK